MSSQASNARIIIKVRYPDGRTYGLLRDAPAMMPSLHGMPLALQVGVPIGLLIWLVRGRTASVSGWLVKTGLVLLYLAAVHLAGLWLLLPWYTAILFATAVAAVVLTQTPRVRRLPWRAPRLPWSALIWRTTLAVFATGVIAIAFDARRPAEDEVVDLQFPLRNGVYYVVGGGSAELLNAHLMTLTAERFRAYRGQSYGNDLVKLNAYGMRAAGWLPADPARYAIYGDPVHAPCSGRVVQMEDGLPDMPPPQPDRTHIPGNHVLLECDGVHVLLAHFQPGTVRVRREQSIEAGAVIGRVGNSGNSNEPHLHIHAQRPAPAGAEPLSGDPLPIRLGGRYLVRNDRVSATHR